MFDTGALRTSPPAHYLTPTREEMREAAEVVSLKTYSPSLLADLANVRAGGEVLPPSAWRSNVERQVRGALRPDSDGDYRLPGGGYTKSLPEAIEEGVAQAVKYHTAVSDFLQTADWSAVPGGSPLTQAAQLLKLLSFMPGGEGGDGEALPIFLEQAGDSVARELSSVLDEVEALDKEEQELLDPDHDETTDTAGSGSGTLRKMKIAEDFLGNRGKREMLRIARNLDSLSRMRVMRESRFQPDPEGDDVRSRPIKNLGEIARVAKPSWAIYQKSRPLFWYRAVSNQLPVRERGVRTERRQLLYIIIDASGSMKNGQRVAKVCGVLFNRLKAVLKSDAVLYFRFFDTDLKKEHFVSNAAEAKQAMEEVRSGNYSGGGTSIDSCTRAALARIEEIMVEGGTHRPELVVVTDGDDTVYLQTEDIGPTRLHAFVVEGENLPLTDLARQTGGVGIDDL